MVSRRLIISVGAALMLTAAMSRAMVVVNCIVNGIGKDLLGAGSARQGVNDVVMEIRG
jgi:hypothetical protein